MIKKLFLVILTAAMLIPPVSVVSATDSGSNEASENGRSSLQSLREGRASRSGEASESGTTTSTSHDPLVDACRLNPDADVCKTRPKELSQVVKEAISIISWIIGVLAVIMIIYAGFLMVTSAGDPGKVATAKNIILYAVIGLIVAISAWAIISFVTNIF